LDPVPVLSKGLLSFFIKELTPHFSIIDQGGFRFFKVLT
jgi:hypothetical protein